MVTSKPLIWTSKIKILRKLQSLRDYYQRILLQFYCCAIIPIPFSFNSDVNFIIFYNSIQFNGLVQVKIYYTLKKNYVLALKIKKYTLTCINLPNSPIFFSFKFHSFWTVNLNLINDWDLILFFTWVSVRILSIFYT